MQKYYNIYIMANDRNTVLYTGVTGSLEGRVWEDKNKVFKKSFSDKYNCIKLVYYETYTNINDAIAREKQLKAGSRKKKIGLIESINPDWKDLYDELFE